MATEVTATVKLQSGMHFRGENAKGLGADMDSLPAGETPAGASPMELVLQAAGGCSLMDIAHILRKKQTPPDDLEVFITGTKRDAHPRIYEKINVTYRAKGAGITVESLEKAVELSLTTYCSVFGMLKQVAEVTHRCEVVQ